MVWSVRLVAGAVAVVLLAGGCAAPARPRANSPSPSPSASPASSLATDLARYAAPVRKYAGQAGINPQLLMAILYNESYKPHDPSLERAWARIDPNPAFGIANMHEGAFNDTRRGRDFAGRDWSELPDDPDLAIESAAWYLHDMGRQLPASWPAQYSRDELLALGYNAGPGNMKAFARGAKPGPQAQSYLDTLRGNWDKAGNAVGQG